MIVRRILRRARSGAGFRAWPEAAGCGSSRRFSRGVCESTSAPRRPARGARAAGPYDKYNFIDGGSKDNLPVKILRDMGVGKVLAIGFDIMTYNPDAGLGLSLIHI